MLNQDIPVAIAGRSTAVFHTKTKKKGAVFRTAVTAQKCYQPSMAMESVSGGHAGAWGGPAGQGGGGPGGPGGATKSSYVGIASLNTSVRDKKNLLEIRLD